MQTYERLFRFSAASLLLLTACAKLFSATGHAALLEFPDPLLGIRNRELLILVGLVELAVVAGLLSGLTIRAKHLLLVWLSSNFVLYRLAFYSLNLGRPCPCLGTLTEKLHLSAHVVNWALSGVVVYLLLGSVCALRWACLKNRPAVDGADLPPEYDICA